MHQHGTARHLRSIPRSILLLLLGLGALPFLAGCLTPAATAPMPLLEYRTGEDGPNPHLLVLLRGLGAGNEVFAAEGIIDEVRRRRLPFDVVAPDAHLGYYKAQTIEERLHDDVVVPYRQRGYRQIWLAGFSMGGMGSLFYLRDYPRDVDGVLLTSPFLGWGSIAAEIRAAGGLPAWQRTTTDTEDWERLIWSWIKDYSGHRDDYPPVYLGYGEGDLLTGSGPALLGSALPSEQVFSIPGNHDIATFKRIFLRHLDRLAQQFGASSPAPMPQTARHR